MEGETEMSLHEKWMGETPMELQEKWVMKQKLSYEESGCWGTDEVTGGYEKLDAGGEMNYRKSG